MWKEKNCSKCKTIKQSCDFYEDSRVPSGLQSSCKKCFKTRVYRYRDSTRGKEIYKKYRSTEEYKTKNRKIHNAWQKTEKGRKYLKEYRQRKNYKKYRQDYEKEYRKRPVPKQKDRVLNQEYINRKRNNSDGTVTCEAMQEMLEKQNYKCNICSCNLKNIIKHLDHIIPITKNGLHSITNVQWLCYICNIRKSNKI